MITPTHVVINAWTVRLLGGRGVAASKARRRAFVLGGLAPDVGLYTLSLGAFLYYPLVGDLSFAETARLVFDDLFYNSALWIVAHNVLHAPLVIAALYAVGRWSPLARHRGAGVLRAFALGCAVHAAVDIPVHHSDGPLLLFPFDWSTRFASPVSYYEPAYYGSIVAPIDLAITVLGTAGLVLLAVRARRARRARATSGEG